MSAPTPPPATPSKRDPNAPAAAGAPTKKKFQNGWTREIEKLMAEWADKAICYRWMHEKTERIFKSKDYAYMFPVIILSTVTGAANFALDSYITNPDDKKNAQLALGTLSIVTGIISTIANRLGYASGSEAHKGAAVMWGKFQRLIAIELSLHPNERTDCMHFLKTCRTELDRLIEQSPTIPDKVIQDCKKEFAHYPKVRKPEIVGDIDTTSIFVDTNSRLREIAKDAAITIQQKKGILKQLVLDDLEPRINRVIENSTLPAVKEELKKDIQKAAEKATRDAIAAVHAGRVTATTATGIPAKADVASAGGVSLVERNAAERATEVQSLAMSGVVSEMRQKLAAANKVMGPTPKGVGSLFANIPSAIAAASTDDIVLHVKDVTTSLPNIPEGEQSDYDEDEDEEEDDGEEEEGDTIEKK
jgi:hypothetical protein